MPGAHWQGPSAHSYTCTFLFAYYLILSASFSLSQVVVMGTVYTSSVDFHFFNHKSMQYGEHMRTRTLPMDTRPYIPRNLIYKIRVWGPG